MKPFYQVHKMYMASHPLKLYAKNLPILNCHWRNAVLSSTDTSNYCYRTCFWREENGILSFCEM